MCFSLEVLLVSARKTLAQFVLIGAAFAAGMFLRPVLEVEVATQTSAPTPQANNAELARLYAEDQADRTPGKQVDGLAVVARDKAREARVKGMLSEGLAKTGPDYYNAAMVLQHAPEPEDSLLAHELSIVALSKGEEHGKWLAAAAEDRFLMRVGRPQRFATQYRSEGRGQPMRLYTVDERMTDALRKEFNVPSLAEAKAREADLNKR